MRPLKNCLAVRNIAIFALLILCCTVRPAIGDVDAKSTALKSELAELKKVAMEAHSDAKLMQKLRPTYGECRLICTDQKNALKLWYFSAEFYEFVKKEGKLPLKETPDEATAAPIQEDFSEFAHLKENLADEYRKGNKWFVVGFNQASGQEVGAYSGFAKVNDRWIFVPRFYQAFEAKTVPPVEVTVLRMFNAEMHDDLYDFCSPRITEQIKREDAANYFRKIGLGKADKIYPQTSSRNDVHGRQVFGRGLNVEFSDGRAASVNLVFDIDDKNDFRLAWVGMYSSIGVAAPSLFAPLPSKSRSLSADVLTKVAKAIESGDFKELHAESAKSIRERLTVEQLKAAFPTTNEMIALIPTLDPQTIKMAQPQSLGRTDVFSGGKFVFRPLRERVPHGPLVLKTVIETNDGKRKLGATFEFFYEKGRWMPSGYSFHPLSK